MSVATINIPSIVTKMGGPGKIKKRLEGRSKKEITVER